VNGSQIYAADVRLPGMLHASIIQSPVFGGFVKRVDDAKAKAMPGVKHVIATEEWVAVLATNWWQANQAVKALKIDWENGSKGDVSSASIMQSLREGIAVTNAPVARKDGDSTQALANAHTVLEAEYHTGFVNHATMEPQTAAALFTPESLEVWVGTQNGEASIAAASAVSGLALDKVQIHKMHAGGAFGRRGPHQDFTKQAVKNCDGCSWHAYTTAMVTRRRYSTRTLSSGVTRQATRRIG
jgi:isoquinoline 1-oxidoreductase subunit beta